MAVLKQEARAAVPTPGPEPAEIWGKVGASDPNGKSRECRALRSAGPTKKGDRYVDRQIRTGFDLDGRYCYGTGDCE